MTRMKQLHTYICPICRSTLIVTVRSGGRQCPSCRAYMRFGFSDTVRTPDQERLYAMREAFGANPGATERKPCVRCGKDIVGVPHRRVDGWCCPACVRAEARPVYTLPTEEQIKVDRARRAAIAQEDQDRMEAAYRALENHE